MFSKAIRLKWKWIAVVIYILLFLIILKFQINSKVIIRAIRNIGNPHLSSHRLKFEFNPNFLKGSKVLDTLLEAEDAYSNVILKRRALVDSNPELIQQWKSQFPYFFENFPSSFNCPYKSQRIGSKEGGGRWICGFELFEIKKENGNLKEPPPAPCIVYSFGINEESSFELEILKRTNCLIYAYDIDSSALDGIVRNTSAGEGLGLAGRITFNKIYIGGKDDGDYFKTLRSLMSQNGHDWIDIFKMNIEVNQFEVLDQLMCEFEGRDRKSLPFGQIGIEFFKDAIDIWERFEGVGLKQASTNSTTTRLEEGADSMKVSNFYKFWERMEDSGLRPFNNEVNVGNDNILNRIIPTFMEYSFINLNIGKSCNQSRILM